MHLATHDIVQFLRSDFGESIVKQCDIRILLGQTPEGADALASYFDHFRPGSQEAKLIAEANPLSNMASRQADTCRSHSPP